MRISRLVTLFLFLCLASRAGFMLPEAFGFTASDNESKVDIESIDIAPTNTPIPTVRLRRIPTPTPKPVEKTTSIHQGESLQPEKKYFTFSLSSSDVDFGTIDPTNPVVRTHRITLDPGSAKSYTLFSYENHPLQVNGDQAFIPDTTCDDGSCTEQKAAAWENTLTYGFGFRCDEHIPGEEKADAKHICVPEFVDSQSYKQFANLSRNEAGASLLRSLDSSTPAEARITYKLNVVGTQKPGSYRNAVVFIAAPGY